MKHIFTNSNESAVVRNGYRCAKVARPLRTAFLIGTLLLTLGVGQMWGRAIESGNVFYFKPTSEWKSASARLAVAFGTGDDTWYWYTCQQVPGDGDVYYVVSNGSYDWMILTRQNPANNENSWSNRWTESERVSPNSNFNKFDIKSGWATDFNWYKYAPPMSSASLASTSTVYGGDGTSGNPYQIKKGTALSVSASATSSVDGGYTQYYEFYKKQGSGSRSTWVSYSTTNTASVTASSTVGVTYEIDVAAKNEYYSNYGTEVTSSKMYFITVDPIYAILGDFNSWSRSAATWDLVDQGSGSNNWDATFSLDKGTYEFKVVYNSVYYGKGTSGYTTITRSSRTVSSLETGESVKNLKITADVTGSYTFRFNSSSKNLTVTFQPAYTVTYGKGTGGNTISASATSAGGTFSSGAYVAAGDDVTFTQTANTGYRLTGWYTASSGGTEVSGMGANDNVLDNLSATATVYSRYAENKSSITISADANGSVTNAGTYSLGVATTKSSTATANNGYYFTSWSKSGNAAVSSTTTNPTTVKGDGTNGGSGTVTANFGKRWVLRGSRPDGTTAEGMPLWSTTTADMTVTAGVSTKTVTLLPNRKYKYMIYDKKPTAGQRGCTSADEASATQPANTEWTLNGGNPVFFNTAGYGTYTFSVAVGEGDKPAVTITNPASYLLTLGAKVYYNAGASNANATAEDGGTVTAHTNENTTGYDITNGQYFASGCAITFTATPATGYSLEGWYSDAACSAGNKYTEGANVSFGENTMTLSGLTTAKTVYAKFTENMTRVQLSFDDRYGNVKLGGSIISETTVGVHTTRSLTVTVTDANYYFAGWERSENPDFHLNAYGEANTTVTLTGDGAGKTSAQILTAKFAELHKVYFRNWDETNNRALWSNVYVFFAITWQDNCAKTNSNSAYKAQMQQIAGTNVYWAYIPHAVDQNTNIAFSDYNFSTNYKFNGHEGAKWGSYTNKLNMYVPQKSSSETINSTKYYNGYWKHYGKSNGDDAGYYMRKWNGSSYVDADATNYTFIVQDDNTITYKLRIDNLAANNNRYMIASAGSIKYITLASPASSSGKTITSSDCSNITMTKWDDNGAYFNITPSSEGDYMITIDQSHDAMNISVNYPVAVNDYRFKHTYSSGSKVTYSDIIKNGSTSAIASMYINTADGSKTLVLEQCTSINAQGKASWETRKDFGVTTTSDNFDDGNGVYQFNVTNPGSSATISDIALYEGKFYLKTDCADGKWASYKNNQMDRNTLNFSTSDSKTFDYYYCKWVDIAGTNVKCVIANDYNNNVSDTLKGDAIIGGVNVETLPYAANVRFSYNSYTNEVKRAYINGATDWQNSFLLIKGGDGNQIRNNNGSAFTNNESTFIDNNDWLYILDLQAKEGGRVKVTANYRYNNQDHVQYLVGESGDFSNNKTFEILGGNGGSWQPLRVIYDFKTNFLLSAWLAGGSVSGNKAIHTNVMIIRDNQDPARQITLSSSSDKLTSVDTVYSTIHLTKDYLHGGTSQASRQFYWVAFPYAVRVSDIFGNLGTWNVDWALQEYNGKKRAANGFWAESEPNWEFIEDPNKILNANEGYVLTLALGNFNMGSSKWHNNVVDLYLYFPSKDKVSTIDKETSKIIPINQTGYQCTIDWSEKLDGNGNKLGPAYDRTIRDSYWHCIGIPSFANATKTGFNDHDGTAEEWKSTNLPFLYVWNSATNELTPTSSSTFTFQPLVSYLVQYSGETITWTNVSTPNFITARQKTEDIHFAEFRLELMNGEESVDHTFVRLTDNEEVTSGFEFGHDLCKEFNNGKANIYTFIEDVQVAGNSLPLESEKTTIVPVGVKTTAAGEYTFAMPEGTNGIGVTLVDNETGDRTNLAMSDYSVTLNAGTIDGRFVLEISPVAQTPTGIEEVTGDGLQVTGARKVMVDGVLYIVKDGKVFDARGARCK